MDQSVEKAGPLPIPYNCLSAMIMVLHIILQLKMDG